MLGVLGPAQIVHRVALELLDVVNRLEDARTPQA